MQARSSLVEGDESSYLPKCKLNEMPKQQRQCMMDNEQICLTIVQISRQLLHSPMQVQKQGVSLGTRKDSLFKLFLISFDEKLYFATSLVHVETQLSEKSSKIYWTNLGPSCPYGLELNLTRLKTHRTHCRSISISLSITQCDQIGRFLKFLVTRFQ